MPIAEAERVRQRESGLLDVDQYATDAWSRANQIIPERTVALADLSGADLDKLGAAKGNRAGDGSPWSFFVDGEGLVREVEADQPRGRILLDTAEGPVELQIGPVVSGTAIRDALPFITFDDVADQTAYAEIGLLLTDRALEPLKPVVTALKPGDRIAFMGAAGLSEGSGPLRITPIKISPASPSNGAGK